jgi:hypothetical protein
VVHFSSRHLLAAPVALSLLALAQPARAILTYNIYETGGNVVVQASGSLNLTGATSTSPTSCNNDGGILSTAAAICTGFDTASASAFLISGPTTFDGSVSAYPASSVAGIFTAFTGQGGYFEIDPAYTSGSPIVSSATFNGTSLAGLGFTPGLSGLIGTWTLDGTSESIQVRLTPYSAPGPLPLLGAGAAFSWSRRLRRRVGRGQAPQPRR